MGGRCAGVPHFAIVESGLGGCGSGCWVALLGAVGREVAGLLPGLELMEAECADGGGGRCGLLIGFDGARGKDVLDGEGREGSGL